MIMRGKRAKLKNAFEDKATTVVSLCFLLVVFIGGCGNSTEQTSKSVIVFAAASTTNAIADIAAKFTEETGIEVTTNFASSSTLAQQIENGADADVYISANLKWGDYLEEKQLCQTRKTILGSRIVIVVPSGSTLEGDTPEILLTEEVTNIAMGDPSHVPAGKYGKEALEKLNLWQQIEPKVAAAKDVRSALAFVETDAAEAGIVYATDAVISDKVKVIYHFPKEATAEPIAYPAMILSSASHPDNARQFFEFLQNDTAKAIFNNYGFITD